MSVPLARADWTWEEAASEILLILDTHMARFLHTADWHLGKTFHSFS